MESVQHAALTARFVAWAEATPSVGALVGVGSTSGLRPADRWSDHDLLIVTTDPDEATSLRQHPSSLPLPERPLLAFTEPDHGLTIILSDGHLLELAVCGPDDLGWFAADRHRVLVDRIGVARLLHEAVRARALATPPDTVEVEARYRHLVKELIVVIARLGRGERISAHRHLHTVVDDLLVLLQRSERIGASEVSDPHDPSRRLERTDPELAARLDGALGAPLEDAVARIIDLLGELMAPSGDDDAPTLQAVLERLLAGSLGAGPSCSG